MSLARGMSNYATAGGLYASEDRFNVSAHVYVPDGNAGTACESSFQAMKGRKVKSRRISFSRNFAFCYMGVLVFGALMYLGLLCFQCNNLSTELKQMGNDMENNRATIQTLQGIVDDNTDLSNISVKARGMGMVASSEESTHFLFLPEIEQFTKAEQTEQTAAAAELPPLGAQAQLLGSR